MTQASMTEPTHALRAEWRTLDERVARVLETPIPARERLLLRLRRIEAEEAMANLATSPPERRDEALHVAEVSVNVLFHALWHVENGGSEPRFDETAARGGRPLPLVARSLRRRSTL